MQSRVYVKGRLHNHVYVGYEDYTITCMWDMKIMQSCMYREHMNTIQSHIRYREDWNKAIKANMVCRVTEDLKIY